MYLGDWKPGEQIKCVKSTMQTSSKQKYLGQPGLHNMEIAEFFVSILREIIMGESRITKICHLEALNLEFLFMCTF